MGGPIPVDVVRQLVSEATSRLVGETIALGLDEWRAPSRLPGWSRAHVATHLTRNADDLGWLALNERLDKRPTTDSDAYFAAMERGADRDALELQIDLDTSAGALSRVFAAVPDWKRPVELRGYSYPLAILPVIRLHEVCLHRLDLGLGAEAFQIEAETGRYLLRWAAHKVADQSPPALQLVSDSGLSLRLGQGEPRKVRGTDAALWAWLCGRLSPSAVEGAEGVEFGLL
ncbi:MAG: maleylpyruvate isomerase family mycothiol-dependent enzyme [Propionibacteriaceae bacterium]|jgi:maleylpyruvate isomerase|nr:maleylpyruvate isomerase family mycothiol-dependent enzyme [Propionibacteriaceae bacterium]